MNDWNHFHVIYLLDGISAFKYHSYTFSVLVIMKLVCGKCPILPYLTVAIQIQIRIWIISKS